MYLYDTLTSDNGLFSVRTGSASLQYSSNGLYYLGTASRDTFAYLNSQLPTNYEIEYTISNITLDRDYGSWCADTGLNGMNIGYSSSSSWGLAWGSLSSGEYKNHDSSKILQNGDVIRFKRENGNVSIYQNNTLLGTISEENTNGFYLKTYNTRGITIKDLKIKAL